MTSAGNPGNGFVDIKLVQVDIPTIGGTKAGQTTAVAKAITPFAQATVGDPTLGTLPETLTVTLSDTANGTLADALGGTVSNGVYTVTGTAAEVQAALRALVFTPTANATLGLTTGFTVEVTNVAGKSATDATTSVQVATTTIGYTGATATYTVPVAGEYYITALGAQGGNVTGYGGGDGAEVGGRFHLAAGEVLTLTVGGQGQGDGTGGGGGGTFVIGSSDTPLVIAGGGGGAGFLSDGDFAQTGTDGSTPNQGGAGGASGSGGGVPSGSYGGGGGGGLAGGGASTANRGGGGGADGGPGGVGGPSGGGHGGLGGGGGGGLSGGGGGGGYSGGGGSGAYGGPGGGGGSYDGGADPTSSVANLGNGSVVITLLDGSTSGTAEAGLSIAATDADRQEGDFGTTTFTFTVSLSGFTTAAHSVHWTVTGSGAHAASASDFAGGVLPTGTLTFAPGETSKTFAVKVAGDRQVEGDEGFTVSLSDPSPGTVLLAASSASGTIRDDDSPTILESFGATRLARSSGQFFLWDAANTGPGLRYQGSPVVAGQFGAWTPIAAEAAAGGYEVVWRFDTADLYTAWKTDTSGNWQSSPLGLVAGSDAGLQLLEPSFQQDLNGDGTIGIKVTTLEAFGATRLDQDGNRFFLRDGQGDGPSLKYQGAPLVAGQFGAWKVLGAEKTATGYEVAWRFGTADQFTVWNTDVNGNYTSSAFGAVGGSDAGLQLLEPSFQQDLNGDGTIGIKVTTLEAFGATRLDQDGNRFFLRDGQGNGPSLKYQGAPLVAGQFGAWKVLGAEKTATGYEVAWRFGTADQFTVWNTDANGNYTSSAFGAVGGGDAGLQLLEPSFQQDLNGDGTIGLKVTTIEAFGATRLDQGGGQFFLHDGQGNGPSLKYQGAPVVADQFGAWKVLGAEKTATGYEVAWRFGTTDQFTVWDTDANGNYTSSALWVVGGSDAGLQLLEPSFQQDLNGDGDIGVSMPASPQPDVALLANHSLSDFGAPPSSSIIGTTPSNSGLDALLANPST
ncbi:MAG: Calx-beta domain-containing protein [Reyranellaceae bacterium]